MQNFTSYYHSPVGWIKIVATDEAINEIVFAEEPTQDNIQNALTQNCVQQLSEYFAGERKIFDLPLQQNGTSFQTKVWELLTKINYGNTLSYLQLSKQFGDVKAIRAVASANGKNNLAIVVPCHRVIGSNASLTGYAGGLWRKKWLLEHEAKFGAGVQTLF